MTGLTTSKLSDVLRGPVTRPLSTRLKIREVAAQQAAFDRNVEQSYRKALDIIDGVEYTTESQDVDAEIDRRVELLEHMKLSERIKARNRVREEPAGETDWLELGDEWEIREETERNSVEYDGMTSSERQARRREEIFQETQEDRRIINKLLSGAVAPDTEEGTPLSWEEGQRKDLKSNFLFAEYMQAQLFRRNPPDFKTFTEVVAGKALTRLMTRSRNSHELIRDLFKDSEVQPPDINDVQMFLILGYHREKDPELYLTQLYDTVPRSRHAVQLLLQRYADAVRETWSKMQTQRESPLPGEGDWLYMEAEGDALENAIDAVLAGCTVTAAAKKFKLSSRRLANELDERGISRSKRKVRK